MTDIASKVTGTQNRRKKVLIIAYACSPYKGSEAGLGWQRVMGIAKYFDCWVICKDHGSEADIKHFFDSNGKIPELHLCCLPRTNFEKLIKRLPGFWYIYYRFWHRRAYYVALRLHREINFDLVHQVNIGTFREPGYLWKLNIPFIWGPIGGTENYPWKFLGENGITQGIREVLRTVINLLQLHFSYRVRQASRKASALLTANSGVQTAFKRKFGIDPIIMLDVGAHEIRKDFNKKKTYTGPLKILWNGSFLNRKGMQLLIKALSKMPPFCKYELKILGDGPLAQRWKRLAERAGIAQNCHWLGWVPYNESISNYEWADILIFTSLRDTCGSVVTEALSRGLPLICLDNNGVGDVIDSSCGIKIAVTNPQDVVKKLKEAILFIDHTRDALHDMRRGALARAQEYSWSRHAERLAEIYYKVIKSNKQETVNYNNK